MKIILEVPDNWVHDLDRYAIEVAKFSDTRPLKTLNPREQNARIRWSIMHLIHKVQK